MRAMSENRGATYWPQALSYLMSTHGMNYWKFLCLQWQHTTGKPCTKRSHQQDDYKRKLECEAQLVESITEANRGAYSTCKELADVLLRVHKDMGCNCGWTPKLKPPKPVL